MTVKDVDMAKQKSEASLSLDSDPMNSNNESGGSKEEGQKLEKSVESIDAFQQKFDACKSSEEKLSLAIDFMQRTLTQSGVPRFKDFWEVRKLCLPLFKETLHAASRAKLWSSYSELSKQARKLKEILDEQSTFAVEQIEIAIQALKKDLEIKEDQIKQSSDISIDSEFLKSRFPFYNQKQKELKLLNAFAARINSLRKELIKTDMRIRQKNLFFQELSKIGEEVFPKRKELIAGISQAFEDDVANFISKNFESKNFESALYHFREEIKAIQNTAKILTLNTHAFSSTRTLLSECWDQIKVIDKERKKHRVQQRIDWKKNEEIVQEKIRQYQSKNEESPLKIKEALDELEKIQVFMREIDLDKESVRNLKAKLQNERKQIENKEKEAQRQRQEKINEKKQAQRRAFEELKQSIQKALEECKDLDATLIEEKKDEMIAIIEKQDYFQKELKEQTKAFDRLILEKKQESLLSLADSDKEALAELKAILKERISEKSSVKAQIENYRKACGSSGLDFEKAIEYQELLEKEKDKLQKISQEIQLIKDKIQEIES